MTSDTNVKEKVIHRSFFDSMKVNLLSIFVAIVLGGILSIFTANGYYLDSSAMTFSEFKTHQYVQGEDGHPQDNHTIYLPLISNSLNEAVVWLTYTDTELGFKMNYPKSWSTYSFVPEFDRRCFASTDIDGSDPVFCVEFAPWLEVPPSGYTTQTRTYTIDNIPATEYLAEYKDEGLEPAYVISVYLDHPVRGLARLTMSDTNQESFSKHEDVLRGMLYSFTFLNIVSTKPSNPVATPIPPDWDFLNTMTLPWRCNDTEPRGVTQDWADHWKREVGGGRTKGISLDFNFPGVQDKGKDVLAPFSGIVTVKNDQGGYGNYVEIESDKSGWIILLAHLESTVVETKQRINQGQKIGTSGTTGRSTGPHIHAELRWKGWSRGEPPNPDKEWLNDNNHYMFGYPLFAFRSVSKTQLYSTNCGEGPVTVLSRDNGLRGPSIRFTGLGSPRMPDWFDNQASSLAVTAYERELGIELFEHKEFTGGSKIYYFQNQTGIIDLTEDVFDNGLPVDNNVSAINIGLMCSRNSNEGCIPSTPLPTSTPSPIATSTPPPPIPTDTWKANFFRDQNLQSKCHDGDLAYGNNSYIIQDWGTDDPVASCDEPNDNYDFSARFWKDIDLEGGHYTFYLFADDQARLLVDGKVIVNQWDGIKQHIEGVALSPGQHQVIVEYRNTGGLAILEAWWEGPGYPTMPRENPDPNQWHGVYWGNRYEWERSIYERNEGSALPLVRDWGNAGPGYGLPADKFSTKYTRTVYFQCGRYRFEFDADDYAEFRLDPDNPPLHFSGAGRQSRDFNVAAGNHVVEIRHREEQGEARLSVNWQLLEACATPTSTPTPTWTSTPTPIPPTATPSSTPTPTRTNTPVPPTRTNTPTPPPIASTTPTSTPTNTPAPTPTAAQPPPHAPSNLQATALNSSQIRLDWDDNSDDETGFRISDGNSIVATVGANTVSYTVQNLAPNTYRCYQVQAFNDYGDSDWSNWTCTTTDSWWNTSYKYRRPVPISTNNTLGAGTVIKIDGMDLETLVNEGKLRSDHNDMRVVHRVSTTDWQEIARVYYTGWDLEFKLSDTINPGTDGSYYLYYGNPNAGSPPTYNSAQGWWADMYHDKWWTELGGTWTFDEPMNYNNVCDPGFDHDGRIGTSFDESDKFRGRLYVPTTGTWTFHLYTHDGYRLYLDNVEVGRFDGYDGDRWVVVGSIYLKAGWHRMDLRNMWVNCGGWKFHMEGPSFPKQLIPANYFQRVWDGVKDGLTPDNEEQVFP